jgi:hypothetical protein
MVVLVVLTSKYGVQVCRSSNKAKSVAFLGPMVKKMIRSTNDNKTLFL